MIIKSLLDTDWYKLSMGQVVFHHFPHVKVRYEFINRGKTAFSSFFKEKLEKEIKNLATLSLTDKERDWLNGTVLSADYIKALSNFKFNPDEVSLEMSDNLSIKIEGLWTNTILWEVPLMALISELYFTHLNVYEHREALATNKMRARNKAEYFVKHGIQWADFGTRRRFAYDAQDEAVAEMCVADGFIGTSNPHLAMKYGVNPIGTYAHESIMAMQAGFGAKVANRKWMELWLSEYSGRMSLALTDTFTTQAFLKDFDLDLASRFEGVRQDSGNPFEVGDMLVKHYESLGIDPKTKKIVFSDNLKPERVLGLHEAFKDRTKPVFGIGTNITNDCDHKPLNMVIKLVAADFGNGMKDSVKLSDDEGKHTGNPTTIAQVKNELGV